MKSGPDAALRSAGSRSRRVGVLFGVALLLAGLPAHSATATNAVGVAPAYDGNGNLTSDGSYGNRTYAYDTLGRLTGVNLAGATTSYALDGAGNRWSQTTGAATTAFDLDLAAPNPTILFDGTAKYLPGAPGLGFESAGVWKNALTDQLGSPIEYVDTAGVVSGLTHSDPYGVPRPGSSPAVGIGFTGEWRDVTGLINLRARSYDPILGRFIGRDTFAGIASAPQTANRYAYTLANPLRYSDPSGHFVKKILLNPVVWVTAASVAMPWLGIAWAEFIFSTGYDPVSGEHVSEEARAFAGATAAFGILAKVVGAVRGAWAATEGIEAAGVSTEARLAGGAFGRAGQAGEARAGTLIRGGDEGAGAVGGAGTRNLRRDIRGFAAEVNSQAANYRYAATRDLLQSIATRAEQRIGGSGAVAGTLKHAYAERLLNRYQSIFGSRGLTAERSFLHGLPTRSGQPGSVRLDVWESATSTAFDYKFVVNPPGLSPAREGQILRESPALQVIEINP